MLDISRKDWDALSHAVSIAQVMIETGKFAPTHDQLAAVNAAREILTEAHIIEPRAYLPTRHPARHN